MASTNSPQAARTSEEETQQTNGAAQLTASSATATAANAAAAPAAGTGPHPPPMTAADARVATAKDLSLKDFLNKMDDYAPIIPDAVTNYYMTRAGLPPPPQTDQRLSRLLALATQKFVADVAADAYQYSRVRAGNSNANNPMGNLGAAAGFPVGGAAAPNMQGSGGAGGAKEQGGGGGRSGRGGGDGSAALGIQRPGFGGGGQGGSQNRTVLTMEDLGMAVGEYGVNVKRGEFYR